MLTNDDIEVLLKALTAYQEQSAKNGMISVFLNTALSRNSDPEKLQFQSHQILDAAIDEGAKIEETIILLKAKLIQMRDRATADEALDFLRDPQSSKGERE